MPVLLTETSRTDTLGSIMEQLHATCVAIDKMGVLIRGPSGSGKSDLALRLIDAGARLVADDRCDIQIDNGRVMASAPTTIAGLLEVRGLGIMRIEALSRIPVSLLIDLVAEKDIERLPEPTTVDIAGVAISAIRLDPFSASAAAKVRMALAQVGDITA